jgi:hypothetical protein
MVRLSYDSRNVWPEFQAASPFAELSTEGISRLTTKLDSQLKRELSILGKPYTLTLSPKGLNLVPKGRRKGYELAWVDLVSGEAALATALNASLARGPEPEPVQTEPGNAEPPRAKRSRQSPQKSR